MATRVTTKQRDWGGADALRSDLHVAKRRLILRAAGALFEEVGFHNTSMEQIARRLGLTKAALYYYFADKHELLMRCFDIGQAVVEQALAHAHAGQGSGLDRVELFVRTYVMGIAHELGACAATLELSSAPPEEIPALRARMRGIDRELRALVQAGIDDGSCAPIDPTLAVNWIMGAMTLMPRWFRPSSSRFVAEGVAQEWAACTRRMLASPAPTPVDHAIAGEHRHGS